jgi:hypothetical protein
MTTRVTRGLRISGGERRKGHEVPLGWTEREALGRTGADVEQEPGAPPALVLLPVDVERDPADLSEQQIFGPEGELIGAHAHREAAVAAAPGLKEDERPVQGHEPLDRIDGRRGGAQGGSRRGGHHWSVGIRARDLLSKEPQGVLVVAD